MTPRLTRNGRSLTAIHPLTGWLGNDFTGGSLRLQVLVVPFRST